MVTIAMSMISGKLGEDKQNKLRKIRNGDPSVGVAPALPLMAGPGAISSTIVGNALSQCDVPAWLLCGDCAFCPVLLGTLPHGTVVGAFWPNGY